MSSDSIKRISARYAAQLADTPDKVDDGIFRQYIADLARDLAATFVLGVHQSVQELDLLALSEEERRKWLDLANERAETAAADFAARTRKALEQAGDTRDPTEIARFAEERFIAEMKNLADRIGVTGGKA